MYNLGSVFWDYSGIGLLAIDSIRVHLGAIPFPEETEYHSIHSARESRMNSVNGIQFTRNTQNTLSFGQFLGRKSNVVTRAGCLASSWKT